MSSLRHLDTNQILEPQVKECVKILKDSLLSEPFINSEFKLMQIAFTAAGTFKVAHGLGFRPTDIIQSSLTGAGALTWNYSSFDSTNLNITTTGACTVRAFIGAYRG